MGKQEQNVVTVARGLTKDELEQYNRDGFILKRGLIPRPVIHQVIGEIDSLHERMAESVPEDVSVNWEPTAPGKPKRLMQVMNSDVVSPTINKIMRGDAILDVVESIIGPRISLFHSKLLMKAAHDGAVTPWHQDYIYWSKIEPEPCQLNCMMAIDPATKENGCIQFAPGTHKQGLQTHEQRKQNFDMVLPGKYENTIYCEMAPGDCIFFGSLVIHGSDGNHSPHHRRANTVAYTVTRADMKHTRGVMR